VHTVSPAEWSNATSVCFLQSGQKESLILPAPPTAASAPALLVACSRKSEAIWGVGKENEHRGGGGGRGSGDGGQFWVRLLCVRSAALFRWVMAWRAVL
jgi:hypothetical protein